MGSYTDWERDEYLKEAYDGPAVAAGPGYFLLNEKKPHATPTPVLAWRIGSRMTLAVTALGCAAGDHYVLNPDGRVARHFCSYGSIMPEFWDNLDAWKAAVTPIQDSGYFGVCPHCQRNDGYLNIGLSHWYFCKVHRVKWRIGWNLFSEAQEETEEEQRRAFNEVRLGEFAEIEPARIKPEQGPDDATGRRLNHHRILVDQYEDRFVLTLSDRFCDEPPQTVFTAKEVLLMISNNLERVETTTAMATGGDFPF